MAYLRHGLVLLYQKACQKASIRARFSHNFLFRVVFLEASFPIMSRRQTKSFLIQQFFKNAGEVWASSPHLRSKLDL